MLPVLTRATTDYVTLPEPAHIGREGTMRTNTEIDTQFQNAILKPADVALELSLKIETVRDLMRRRILPATKVGGSWRTTRRALYGYLENQMGVSSGVHVTRGKNSGSGILQAKKRSKTVGKGRKKSTDGKPEEIFFTR